MPYFSPMRDHKDYLDWNVAKEFVKKAENLRDRALFALLLLSGRRVSEIISLKVSDIDFNNQTIKFKILKKRKEHFAVIPVNELLLKVLADYIVEYKLLKEDWLFPSRKNRKKHITRNWVFMLVKYYANKYNLYAENKKYPHPHTFRHTFATHLARNLKDIQDIKILQDFLQHSDVDMTFYYIRAHSRRYREIVEDVLM